MESGLSLLLSMTAMLVSQTAWASPLDDAHVDRADPESLTVEWQTGHPVDVFVTESPDGDISHARQLAMGDRDGRYTLTPAGTERHYFLLRDGKAKQTTMVAERLLPLERGSNFRDIGGYPGADGRHVRWGRIYCSGASAMLTDADVKQVQSLGLTQLVDLRSNEERVLAPTRIDGVPYSAVGYSMMSLMKPAGGSAQAAMKNGGAVYRNFPTMLAPQLRIVFAGLLADKSAVAYNCSAGQDRTGFVTAMILTALGTPRDIIIRDYHLSTQYRQPANEMPKIDLAAHPSDPAAVMFAKFQSDPRGNVAQPLKEADGSPFLASAFDEIENRWGSVDGYLEKKIGLDRVKIARLRSLYLR